MASSPGAIGALHGEVSAQAPGDIDRGGLQRLPRLVERRAVRPRQHAVRVVHADDDVGPAGDRPGVVDGARTSESVTNARVKRQDMTALQWRPWSAGRTPLVDQRGTGASMLWR